MLARAAALVGFLAVALGAFGAHALDSTLTAQGHEWWNTATIYALPHAAAALAIALSGRGGLVRAGGWAMVVGAVIFAGTLYALALGAPSWTGAITPIGGLSFLAGWALCGWGATRSES